MSELDDAIREHLELKRRHGAREAELKDLEDEAFGTGERPLDPFKAGAEVQTGGGEGEKDSSTPADEAKPPSDSVSEAETKLDQTPADLSDLPDLPESPESGPDDEPVAEAPAAEEPAEAEDEASAAPPPPPPDSPIPPPPPRPDPGSEVVHQPTQEHPAPDPPSEELARAADEFEAEFGETTGAKDDEPEPPEEPPAEPAADGAGDDGPMLFDFEAESGSTSSESPPLEAPAEPEGDFGEREPLPDPDDAFSDLGPAEPSTGGGELPFEDEDLPPEEALSHDAEGDEGGPGAVTADTSERDAIDPTEQYSVPDEEQATEFEEEAEDGPAEGLTPSEGGKEDLLEETPDFLEEKPEGDEDLWFEKKPPKDFDFEDEG